jgi:hypothetical protein
LCLSAGLQSQGHFFKPSLRILLKAAPKEWNQNAAELLAVLKEGFSAREWLDDKAMFTLKSSWKQKPAFLLVSCSKPFYP